MVSAGLRAGIEAAITRDSGTAFRIHAVAPASGGCIHESFRVEGRGGRYFVKTNAPEFADAFAAEADGLAALLAAGMRAPRPLVRGLAAGRAFLVMEYLELGRSGDWAAMGRELAGMHRATGKRYGWRGDNFIGSTLQTNRELDDWWMFWRDARLLPQLALAQRNRLASRLIDKGEQLADRLPGLLGCRAPVASLLHGDLWSGNAGFCSNGAPVLFDPAVYYGDREADLAMTELFGGFPRGFYTAYAEVWPLDTGYPLRRNIYNLYHVLNHANLFGGAYAAQAEATLDELLSESER